MQPEIEYVLAYFRTLYRIPDDIKIGYGTTGCKINVAACDLSYFEMMVPPPVSRMIRKVWQNKQIPFLFDATDSPPVFSINDGKAFIHYDILASAFFFLSGWQEQVYMRRHSALRFPYEESLQKKLAITRTPVVNYYFDILNTAIRAVTRFTPKNRLWDNRKAAVCLTHDIDLLGSGWKEGGFHEIKNGRVFNAFKLLARKAAGRDVWFNLAEILALEKKHNVRSTFFFLPRKGRSPKPVIENLPAQMNKMAADRFSNADYDIRAAKLRRVLRNIREAGSEIGLHGSVGSHLLPANLREDLQRLGVPAKGVRFHILYYDIAKSPALIADAGLQYDATLGFAEEPGFRNGIAFPFPPYNFSQKQAYPIVEIPLTAMDTTFRVYQKTPPEKVAAQILNLFDEVQKFNGLLTILWHNNYFSLYKFAGWREVYEDLLVELQRRGAQFLTGGEVYKSYS